MLIKQKHNTTKKEAVEKIDNFLNGLMKKDFPGGVTIKNPEKTWTDSTMNFSFKAKKGLMGTTISGTIKVTDTDVVLDSTLPGLVTTFVGEDKVKEVITKELAKLFIKK
jgi:hypothetical protein